MITKQVAANKLADYLRHTISLDELVQWAEVAMIEGDFDDRDAPTIAAVVARLGVGDVRAFGLTWEDCESLLQQLGFNARVDIVAA